MIRQKIHKHDRKTFHMSVGSAHIAEGSQKWSLRSNKPDVHYHLATPPPKDRLLTGSVDQHRRTHLLEGTSYRPCVQCYMPGSHYWLWTDICTAHQTSCCEVFLSASTVVDSATCAVYWQREETGPCAGIQSCRLLQQCALPCCRHPPVTVTVCHQRRCSPDRQEEEVRPHQNDNPWRTALAAGRATNSLQTVSARVQVPMLPRTVILVADVHATLDRHHSPAPTLRGSWRPQRSTD